MTSDGLLTCAILQIESLTLKIKDSDPTANEAKATQNRNSYPTSIASMANQNPLQIKGNI